MTYVRERSEYLIHVSPAPERGELKVDQLCMRDENLISPVAERREP